MKISGSDDQPRRARSGCLTTNLSCTRLERLSAAALGLKNLTLPGFPGTRIRNKDRSIQPLAAQVLKLTDLGTVAVGKSADFIVLDANPLDNITNTRRVAMVYLRGTAVDRAALRNRWIAGKSE